MSGLSFGVDVATKQTTGIAMNMACSSSGDDAHPCLCGLMYRPLMFCATGTITVDGGAACAAGIGKTFNVTSQSEDKATDGLVEGLPLCRKYLLERLIT
jgi:hypothetical protein